MPFSASGMSVSRRTVARHPLMVSVPAWIVLPTHGSPGGTSVAYVDPGRRSRARPHTYGCGCSWVSLMTASLIRLAFAGTGGATSKVCDTAGPASPAASTARTDTLPSAAARAAPARGDGR